ncbi:hypothetical protein ACIBEJ_30500 [Nonomuraea sp. NPDC050790]|uniref:hypothetical protein n=1 Tax=Nonomuraea sp. NPDC050790 TaxID=3364371 RepID=UPI0037B8CE98
MNDLYQPGPLSPPGRADSTTPTPTPRPVITDGTDERVRYSFDELTAQEITAARRACYTAAAEAVAVLQNGRRLVGEQVFAAAYAQTFRAWWDRVDQEITTNKLSSDHAVRRVRSWARHHLTGEPPAPQPGTLFDHGLAHASRLAARDFLHVSGRLLTHHLAGPGEVADLPAPGTPVDHHPDPGHTAASPAAFPALPPATPQTADTEDAA